ncbi:MAG: phage major capsid protein [Eubacteriales bacterium]|nr:phage major capsid protein [Eubacteriales bacterium]MDD4513894.1 phage major capsid protein [Eubacteriales bacterium]
MNQILTMREKRANLWDAAKKYRDAHIGEDGTMSAEDAATYDRMVEDVDRMKTEVERLERQQAIDAELNQPTAKPLTGKPLQPGMDEKTGRATDSYRNAFWKAMRNKTVRPEVYNALEVGTDSEGGYLVPDEYEHTLIEALEEKNIFRRLAHVIHTSSGERKIPVSVSKGTAAWIDEEAAYPESDDSFGQVSISAYKLATMIKISEELLNDSVFNMPAYISKEFARRIGAAEEEAFFTGNGTGKPLGILAATGGAQTGLTAASSTTVTFDEIIDLYYSLRAPYRQDAVFIMNDATIKALRKLKNGSGDYIWQPSVTLGAPDRVLNRPVYTSQYMPTLAAGAKTILFGDLSYYWVADREGRQFKRLNELYAATGQVGFLASERVDGKLILGESVQVLAMKA